MINESGVSRRRDDTPMHTKTSRLTFNATALIGTRCREIRRLQFLGIAVEHDWTKSTKAIQPALLGDTGAPDVQIAIPEATGA